MNPIHERIKKKIDRLRKWTDRSEDILKTHLEDLEVSYQQALAEFDQKLEREQDQFSEQEQAISIQIDQEGKKFSTAKYKLEREANHSKADIKRLNEQFLDFQNQTDAELKKIEDDRVKSKILHEKQKNALNDMYAEQIQHLTMNREKMIKRWTEVEAKFKETKSRYENELLEIEEKNTEKINALKGQLEAKKQGWETALSLIQKELTVLKKERENLEQKLLTIKEEKGQELELAQVSLASEKEKLAFDKKTIIANAETDQKKCEADIEELKQKIVTSERELQDLVISQEQKKKNEEESYVREEDVIKESLRNETAKRDHEQKMFEQEKLIKQKELNQLREEYERKKWHWENQLRTLMMKKSVQEAELDAERLRTDREARVVLRSLEAKRDELKQRLAEIKGRHANLEKNFKKETDLIQQRWSWRKERLWSIWQERIEVLRKERGIVQEQLNALLETFSSERTQKTEDEKHQDQRVQDLQQFVLHMESNTQGQRKGREIQNELEKTRLIAQVKECETLIQDWMDRLKRAEEEFNAGRERFGEQLNFVDRLYRDEQGEGEVFLNELQRAIMTLSSRISEVLGKEAA